MLRAQAEVFFGRDVPNQAAMVHRKAAAAAVTQLHVRTEKPNLASPVTQAAEQVAAVRQFWKAFQNRVPQLVKE